MSKPNVQFNGNVGQVINGGDLGRVDAKITFGPNGEMVVVSTITEKDSGEE